MDDLKTWLLVVAVFALGFVTLAWLQTHRTLTLRETELALLKVHGAARVAPVSAPQAPVAVSSQPVAPEAPAADPPEEDLAVEPVDNSAAFAALYAERDRYKDGLEKCVAEANRLAQGSGRRFEMPSLAVPAAGAAPSGGPVDEPHISALYSEPTVIPLGDRLQVTGKLFNTGKVKGTVAAVISLLRDGRPVTTARETVTVPAQGQAAWSHTFPWSGQEGAWTAIVRVE